jgi:hypothetical protein
VDAPRPLNGLECRASESADSDTRVRAPRQSDYRRLGVDRAAAGAKAAGAKAAGAMAADARAGSVTATGQIQGA